MIGDLAEAESKVYCGGERRRVARLACSGFAEVVVHDVGFLFRGEISDFSEFGCFVKSKAMLHFQRSDRVELRFRVNGDTFSVTAQAAVVRSGVGSGFEFLHVEPEMQEKLQALTEKLKSGARANPNRK